MWNSFISMGLYGIEGAFQDGIGYLLAIPSTAKPPKSIGQTTGTLPSICFRTTAAGR